MNHYFYTKLNYDKNLCYFVKYHYPYFLPSLFFTNLNISIKNNLIENKIIILI